MLPVISLTIIHLTLTTHYHETHIITCTRSLILRMDWHPWHRIHTHVRHSALGGAEVHASLVSYIFFHHHQPLTMQDYIDITAAQYLELDNPRFEGQSRVNPDTGTYYMYWRVGDTLYRTTNSLYFEPDEL